jgi:hypothetical protein
MRRPTDPRRALSAAGLSAALVACLACAGCDLFKPATPETARGGTTIRVDLTDPDSTLATMARAIQRKATGLTAYTQTLSDPTVDGAAFNTVFDPAVANKFVNVPSTWSNQLESDFFGRLTAKWPEAYRLEWAEDEQNPDDPSAPLIRHRRYQLFRETAGGDTRIAVGFAKLTFRLSSGRYVVQEWEDHVDPAIGINPLDADDVTFTFRRLQP